MIKNIKLPTFWENYEYFINEEKRTVVAKERYFCTDFYRKLDELDINPHIKQFICTEWVKFCQRRDCFSITAKAVCAENDEFSAIIGTEIARLRLEKRTQKLYGDFFIGLWQDFGNFRWFSDATFSKAADKVDFLNRKLTEFLEEGSED
jgi:hypothetical protein